MVVTAPLVPSAVPLLVAIPGILLNDIHNAACLDDCSEIVWSVFYLQEAMRLQDLPDVHLKLLILAECV